VIWVGSIAGLLMLAVVACGGGGADGANRDDYDVLAEALCPMLWDWQKSAGETINEMSAAASGEADAEARQSLYLATFGRLDAMVADLVENVRDLPESIHTDAMRAEIAMGAEVAERELADLTSIVAATPASEEPPGRQRVPTFFGEFEKVIDVVKPELAGYADAELTTAFTAVATCQFGVKDVDDGVARPND